VSHSTSRRTPRLVTVLAAAGATVALAGCGSNINAQTQEWYDATDGVNNSADSTLDGMASRSVVVVSDGTDATVVGTFVNTGVDTDGVASITVDGEDATITGDLEVEPDESVRLGPPGEARAQVDGVDLDPGLTTEVEITFDAAPAETLTAIIRAPEAEFADSGPE
jgi:hypothetical protein